LSDDEIGALPTHWNWLEGSSSLEVGGELPRAVHFTRGGPWMAGWENVQFADLWHAEYGKLQAADK
jgi:hypothetical protein